MVSTSRKIKEYCFHQTKLLIPSARTRDSLKRSVSTMRKSCFHRVEYLQTNRRKWFPIVGERLFYKRWLHLNLNNGFHQHKICSESKSTRQKNWNENLKIRNQAFNKNICLQWLEKLLPVSGIEKVEENWLISNFKNGVHQQKKALVKHKVCNLPGVHFHLPEWSICLAGPKNSFHSNLSEGIKVNILEVVDWSQVSNHPSQLESTAATRISRS